ncbi:MAG: hypothetical protein ISS19_06485 [Bacteroidales bacterium]|nr:hypothetical protein [Bacteroidales bacterium]
MRTYHLTSFFKYMMTDPASHIDKIRTENEYHDLSERLRILQRTIIQLIMIKEEYEEKIAEYLEHHIDTSRDS